MMARASNFIRTNDCLEFSVADFAILVNCGMHWLIALLFNFISSFSALLGFFFGMVITTYSEGTKEWLLAVTAGSFLYIALADLVRNGERRE